MPITESAKKALRGSKRKRVFNTAKKELINKSLKKIKKLIADKNIKEAKSYMSTVQKILDKSAKTGLIKPNNSSRIKSRLSAMIKKAQ